MFSHAHNFNITNSTFNYSSNQDAVSTMLYQHVASGAIIDSSDRFPPGRCHPGTRKRMIERINDWIHDPSPKNNVLWLYGPAGSGKSALAQSIAEALRQLHPERYGASFFFARGPTDRGRGDMLFSTLAYQLALQIPSMRKAINDVLAHDPILPTKSLNYQLERLIVGPLQVCSEEWPSHMPTVFIDGLDECDDGEEGLDTQSSILTLISEAVVKHGLPIRFFIASRPEYWIRDSFEIGVMKSLAYHVSLRDDADADQDMKKYLQDGFEEIRLKNMRVMRSVEPPWPPGRIIDRIVEDASGQYIYASTVLKFIGKASRYCDPQEQLRIITTPGPHRASAFSDLDKLYATVLSAYPRPESMTCVLGGLLANATTSTIRVCLGIEETEVTLVLDALSSLINVTEPQLEEDFVQLMEPIFGSPLEESRISFCHLSFREFLEDESRSGRFFVDVRIYREQIGRKLLEIIGDNLKSRYETEPHIIHKLGLSVFNSMMGSLHARFTTCSEEVLISLLRDITRKTQEFLPIGRIKFPACLMRDMDYLNCVSTDVLYHKERPGRKLASIASEMGKTAELALASARNALADSDQFELTPTLVRIDMAPHSGDTGRLDSYRVFHDGVESVEATVSSLRMHRHIINTESFLHSGEWFSDLKMFGITMMSSIQHYKNDTHGWLSREQWDNAYTLVFYQYLNTLLNTNWKEGGSNFRQVHMIQTLLWSKDCLRFLSRVTSEEAFRRSHKVAIFELFTDTLAWTELRSRIDDSPNFTYMMEGILLWLHSEMTNLVEREYIRRYDENLPDRIIKAMREVFEQSFSPESLVSTPFFLHEHLVGEYRSVEFFAPSEGNGEPSVVEHETISDWGPSEETFKRRHKLYQELFGGTSVDEPSVYPISTVYPRLASFALRALVKQQASFGSSQHEYILQDKVELSYVFRCISYALPTHENLTSLRALWYLDTNFKDRRRWYPPAGFCLSISKILKKFNTSDLSTDELECFQKWLEKLKALEIPLDEFDFQKNRYDNTIN